MAWHHQGNIIIGEALHQSEPVLNFSNFNACHSRAGLKEAYARRGLCFHTEGELLAQIQFDWSKAQVGAARHYTLLREGILEPTSHERNGKSRMLFGMKHCIDPTLPDFTEHIEDHIRALSPGPLYVEHNIGPALELCLPYGECPDWIVMSTAERFCYGVAIGVGRHLSDEIVRESHVAIQPGSAAIMDLSKVALNHLFEPTVLGQAEAGGISLMQKVAEHQGVFAPLVYSSSPYGILPEYVDLELKLFHGYPLSVNERRSLFMSQFLDELEERQVNFIMGATHSAQVSHFQRTDADLRDYAVVQELAKLCARMCREDPVKFRALCDREREKTLSLISAGEGVIESIINRSFHEGDATLLANVEQDIRRHGTTQLEDRLSLYLCRGMDAQFGVR